MKNMMYDVMNINAHVGATRRGATFITAGFSLQAAYCKLQRRGMPRLYCLLLLLLAALSAGAQRRHQFSIHAGGGLSTFDYKTLAGSTAWGFGSTLGADYTLFFGDTWGIATGLEAALFNGKYSLPTFSDAYPSHDGTESFEFNYALTHYNETQQAILLNIPLMLRFERGWFYAAVGAKAGIRLHAAYKNSLDELTASGYYSQYNLTLHDPAFMGFGTFNNISNEGDVALKTAFFASAEVGVKWGKLYTGLYLDYGLNDINNAPVRTPGLVRYELPEPAAYQPQSVLASTAAGDNMADKLRPLSAGIKITFVIGRSKAKAKPAETVMPVAPQPAPAVQAEAERQRLAEEEAQHQAETARQEAEAQRQAEEARRVEAQRQYAADMQLLEKPVAGYTINNTSPIPSIKSRLDETAEILQRYPDLHIQIEGHACEIGSHAVNMQIGQRRADAVKAYLVEKGIAADRITSVSKGKTQPIAPNTTEENRRKNRRVEMRVISVTTNH